MDRVWLKQYPPGVPNDIDPHHFVVDIPAARANPVLITEQFGLSGGTNGLPDSIERCRLNQDAWNAVRKELERVLNDRLKEKKLATSRWKRARRRPAIASASSSGATGRW